MGKILLALVTLLGVTVAQAKQNHATGPLWSCEMNVDNAKGRFTALGVGGSTVKGTGTLKCSKVDTTDYIVPIKMKVDRAGFGVGHVDISDMKMRSISVGVNDPKQLFGEYSFGVGLDITLLKLNTGLAGTFGVDDGVDLNMEIYGAKAKGAFTGLPTLGFLIGGLVIHVEQDDKKLKEGEWLDKKVNKVKSKFKPKK